MCNLLECKPSLILIDDWTKETRPINYEDLTVPIIALMDNEK